MDAALPCLLALLEVTFVFVGLLLLHSLRKMVFGSAAFYIAVGLLLIFTQLVSSTELKVVIGYPGMDFYIAPSVLFLPYLAIIMVVYITEGTLATQRLIIGAMVTLGFYVYLSHLTIVQCGWTGYSISQGPSADSLEYLLRNSQRNMASSILAQTLDLFLIPIFFQRLRNMGCRLFLSVLGALMLTQLVDTFVFVTACFWGSPQWWLHIKSSYIVKAFLTIWLSIIATIYLSHIERQRFGQERSAIDIILSFVGSYGRAIALEKNLLEWEGRYRVVIENASDMIFLLNREGRILDANLAAVQKLEMASKENLIEKPFKDILADTEDYPFDLDLILETFKEFEPEQENDDGKSPAPQAHTLSPQSRHSEIHMLTRSGRKVEVDVVMNRISVEEMPVLIVFGRDVTEQNLLEKEKEELREQLGHAQRLEAVGKLAGGVAHDFNNYLHSIQGNLDILLYMHEITDEKILKHLNRINDITEQSSKLTQQLLGFARKGKYKVERIVLGELLEETVRLFSPQSLKSIEFRTDFPKRQVFIKGDAVQLKQVFLNIFINARDACELKGGEGNQISVSLAPARQFQAQFDAVTTGKIAESSDKYCCTTIADTGIGIDSDIINRIFDPFFTTKPVGKGTGMGLAMAYGAVTNHHGFIHVESEKNVRTAFHIFLPLIPSAD